MTQIEKVARFQELHQRNGVFLIPNPWDISSARILAGMGFEALATSSAASANALGRKDHGLKREDAIAHARAIVSATNVPVSADLENGFGDAPATVSETIRLAADTGLAGCSIEDANELQEKCVYDLGHATERIAAAAGAVKSLGFPFMLTARAENFVIGKPDLDDTIKRLVAYQNAGADVLFAPGLPDLAAVKEVCAGLNKPVNFMAGIKGKSFTVAELAAAGVKRISFAASLYRAAMTGLANAARETKEHGTFRYLDSTMTTADLNGLFGS